MASDRTIWKLTFEFTADPEFEPVGGWGQLTNMVNALDAQDAFPPDARVYSATYSKEAK